MESGISAVYKHGDVTPPPIPAFPAPEPRRRSRTIYSSRRVGSSPRRPRRKRVQFLRAGSPRASASRRAPHSRYAETLHRLFLRSLILPVVEQQLRRSCGTHGHGALPHARLRAAGLPADINELLQDLFPSSLFMLSSGLSIVMRSGWVPVTCRW